MSVSDCKHQWEQQGFFLKCKLCALYKKSDNQYKDEPVSIGELRSNKHGATAKDWSSRDALVNVLRLIDNKEIDPVTLIIGYAEKDGGVYYSVSSKHSAMRIYILGLLQRLIHLVNVSTIK